MESGPWPPLVLLVARPEERGCDQHTWSRAYTWSLRRRFETGCFLGAGLDGRQEKSGYCVPPVS